MHKAKGRLNNQSIEHKTVNGIFWCYAEEILTSSVSFIVSVILARLLVPADYALVSIAAIIIQFSQVVIDGGLSNAIIQKGNADGEDYSTVFSLYLVISLIIYGIIFFSAPAIGRLYHQEELINILRVLCLLIVVYSMKSIFYARIYSQLAFKKLFYSSLSGTLISVVIGVFLAYKGYGAWALVAQQLTDACIDTVIAGFTAHVPLRFSFSLSRFKALFQYSHNVLLATLTAKLMNSLTSILISFRFSLLDLTYYTKARALSGYILGAIESPLSKVLFPALSQIKDDREKLLELLRNFYRFLYFFSLPALMGLYVVADDFIILLFTEKWSSLIPYMHIFIISMLFNKNIQGIKAIGRSDLYRKAVVGCRFLGMACFIVALLVSESPLGAAASFIVTNASYFFAQVYLENKYLNYKIREQIQDIMPSLLSSFAMVAGLYVMMSFPAFSEIHVAFRFVLKIIVGIILYFIFSLMLNKKVIKILVKRKIKEKI